VIDINPVSLTAQKCTLCYDRTSQGLVPACAQACPTASIQFGTLTELRQRAEARVAQLKERGVPQAYLYGADGSILGGLGAFYLLVDEPAVYGLPKEPRLPTRNLWGSALFSAAGAAVVGLLALLGLRMRKSEVTPQGARGADSTHGASAP
jgi:formate dehydrogenase iron-sulfur subunit